MARDYVKVLPPGQYDIEHGHMHAPSNLQALPPLDQAAPFIAAAFDLAPPSLQNRLCERDASGHAPRVTLLVDEDSQSTDEMGWARWLPDRKGEQYIGLNRSFLNTPQTHRPPLLHEYETDILTALLSRSGDGTSLNHGSDIHTGVTILPQASSASPGADTPAMSVLAVIAHEMGHLLYSDVADANGPRRKVWGPDFCGAGHLFHDGSWQIPDKGFGDSKFHGFGKDDTSSVVAIGLPSIQDVWIDLKNNKTSKAAIDMLNVYGGSVHINWANLFATVAKDEDFVETYRIMVLMRAQPTSQGIRVSHMTLSIGNPPASGTAVDVVANFASSSLLAYKAKCITDNNLLPP